jgi:ubiquinone/menaquinone biosynthesis C-methylase UbiE
MPNETDLPNQTDLHGLAKQVGDDWAQGAYYDEAERAMGGQWRDLVWPIISGSDFSQTMDQAAGHGRNTALLLQHAGHLTAVDINETNIAFLKQRFGDCPNIRFIKNNGFDLREVSGASVSFLYSFDAMVHFDSDVVRNYIKEFRRVMKPGAQGFCHYSNNYHIPTGSYRDHGGWRNFMSRQLFEHWLTKEGLQVLESHYVSGVQQIIATDDGNCDAVTLFRLPEDAVPMRDFADSSSAGSLSLQARLDHAEAQLSALRCSTSWRATQPLRWVMERIRRA